MKELISILTELHPELDFSAPHDLVKEGILDSIDIVTLIGEIDEVYGIQVPLEEITPENFSSVEAIYQMIERLRGQ